jgi:hypothetical protein
MSTDQAVNSKPRQPVRASRRNACSKGGFQLNVQMVEPKKYPLAGTQLSSPANGLFDALGYLMSRQSPAAHP